MNPLKRILPVLLLLQPLTVFAANPAFDQAVLKYKARQFSAALAGFQVAARTNPADPTSHYYMALCYQGMNQMSLAKQEYEWVSRCNNAQLRGYAASGLTQLSKYPSSYTGSSSFSSAVPGRPTSAATPKISGRLKVIEFYADW